MKPDLENLTLAPFDDDDDDFQNPTEAIAFTQSLILSSLTNPSSQPLRPSNGARPRKRHKPSAAKGKENHRAILSSDNKLSATREEKEPIRLERSGLSLPITSVSVELPANTSNKANDECNENFGFEEENLRTSNLVGEERRNLLVPIGSGSVETGTILDTCVSNIRSTIETDGETSTLLPSDESKPVKESYTQENYHKTLKGCSDSWCLKEGKGRCYSMSIESRLLRSRENTVQYGVTDDDACGDFEPGTQLKELMNLCCEMGKDVGSSNGDFLSEGADLGVEASKLEMNDMVECPLCGTDITGLSEELRQVHTNDCLDKAGTSEGTVPASNTYSSSPEKIVDVNPVLEWLKSIGLSRYDDAFIKEEIDWETLQWLTEEDLLGIGVVALGPRKKIIHALDELRKRNNHKDNRDRDVSNTIVDKTIKTSEAGNKLITQYFEGSADNRPRTISRNKPLIGIEKSGDSVHKRAGTRKYRSKAKSRDTPPWCCIPGTPFRVDAFRFLRGDCSHWFLTHFHTDHYQGLTRSFCHGKIYCSSITARLVNMKIGVPWDRLHILPLNQKITVAGVNLTCLDANHCPGSLIILFEPPNGKAVLHTGDFRFSEAMISFPALQSCHVHTLILDTTYCNPQYDFPKQEAVIQFVIEAIQAEAFNLKTLFLIGTYTIGKERLFLEVARLLRKKIYVGSAKLSLLRCLELPDEDMQWFTANEMESHIHVVPMWTIASFKRMKYISNQYSTRFNLIVSFSPTGWTFGKGKKKNAGRRWQQGTIIRYEVPYSEHSSFSELRDFVQYISAEHIIPSVNNDSAESADAMIALLMSDP